MLHPYEHETLHGDLTMKIQNYKLVAIFILTTPFFTSALAGSNDPSLDIKRPRSDSFQVTPTQFQKAAISNVTSSESFVNFWEKLAVIQLELWKNRFCRIKMYDLDLTPSYRLSLWIPSLALPFLKLDGLIPEENVSKVKSRYVDGFNLDIKLPPFSENFRRDHLATVLLKISSAVKKVKDQAIQSVTPTPEYPWTEETITKINTLADPRMVATVVNFDYTNEFSARFSGNSEKSLFQSQMDRELPEKYWVTKKSWDPDLFRGNPVFNYDTGEINFID